MIVLEEGGSVRGGELTCILVKDTFHNLKLHLHLCAACGRIKNTFENALNFRCECRQR